MRSSPLPQSGDLPPRAPAVAARGGALAALVAGGASGIILLLLNIAMAGLVYPGGLGDAQARGVGLMLLGAVLLALITTLASGTSIAIAAPQAATVVIAAAIVAGVYGAAPPGGADDAVFATALAGVIVSSLVGGLALYLLGATGLGRLARFLPYPVVGGFIAGVGWLFIAGAINMSTGLTPGLSTIAQLLTPPALMRWVPAAVVGAILVGGRRWWNPLLLFPVTLLGAIALFHLALAFTGTPLSAAASGGWVLGPFASGPLVQPLRPTELQLIDWGLVAGQAPNIAAMPVIAAIVMVLYLSGIEIGIRRDLDFNRELRAGGLGTLAGGLVGGVTGFHLLALSMLVHRMGVQSKLAGVTATVVVALPLLFDAAALNGLPRFVLSGLLIYFGYTFMHEWLVTQRLRMSRLDYGVVLLIMGVIAVAGLLPGVAAGLVAALLLFATEYSRVPVVRRHLSGVSRRSRVTRTERERQLLDAAGERISIFELQGYIFFGTAAGLTDTIRGHMGAAQARRYLVLDFAAVTGLDSAGLYGFSRLQQQAPAWGVTVLLSAMPPSIRRQFDAAGIGGEGSGLSYVASLDRALEWCESALLQAAEPARGATTIADQLRDVLPDPAGVERLMAYLERREAAAGERLLRQGDPADSLLFIESGVVSAQIERPGAAPIRLQTIAGGTVVGEIGFYLSAPRTTDVVCDEPCVVYRLSAAALQEIRAAHPDLASAIHEHLARRMAERLTHTIRALDAALDATGG